MSVIPSSLLDKVVKCKNTDFVPLRISRKGKIVNISLEGLLSVSQEINILQDCFLLEYPKGALALSGIKSVRKNDSSSMKVIVRFGLVGVMANAVNDLSTIDPEKNEDYFIAVSVKNALYVALLFSPALFALGAIAITEVVWFFLKDKIKNSKLELYLYDSLLFNVKEHNDGRWFNDIDSNKPYTASLLIDTVKTIIYYLVMDNDTIYVDDIEGRKQGNLITMTTEQALKYKIADKSADTFNSVLDSLGFSNAKVQKTSENWSENFVRFLTNPVVASLLTTFGFLGILFELQSPGWGIPGSIGLICLILSLSASYIAELATMNDFLIILIGMLCIILEALVFPGFGIPGIAGIIFILWGLYLLLLPDIPVGEEVLSQASNGLFIGIIGGLIGLVLLFRAMTKTKFWKDLTSPGGQNKEDGYAASFGWEKLVGETALTETDLHPSGWIVVNNERIFAVSEGNFIDKNVKVIVLSVDGNRVVVRKK